MRLPKTLGGSLGGPLTRRMQVSFPLKKNKLLTPAANLAIRTKATKAGYIFDPPANKYYTAEEYAKIGVPKVNGRGVIRFKEFGAKSITRSEPVYHTDQSLALAKKEVTDQIEWNQVMIFGKSTDL